MKPQQSSPPKPQTIAYTFYRTFLFWGRIVGLSLLIVALIKAVALQVPVVPIRIGWVVLILFGPTLAMLIDLDGQRRPM